MFEKRTRGDFRFAIKPAMWRLVLACVCLWISADIQADEKKSETPKPYITTMPLPKDGVLVEIQEIIRSDHSWDFVPPEPVERYVEKAFGFVEVPHKYSQGGLRIGRGSPFVLRASANVELPKGRYQFLIRSRSASRLYVDGKLLVQTPFSFYYGSSHRRVIDLSKIREPHLRRLQTGDHEEVATFNSPGGSHRFLFEVYAGGKKQRAEMGETLVSLRRENGGVFHLLSPAVQVPLTEDGWYDYLDRRRNAIARLNRMNRRKAAASQETYWTQRHELARTIVLTTLVPVVPPAGDSSSARNAIDRFINHKLDEAGLKPAELIGGKEFLRRIALDLIGTIPTAEQVNTFLNDSSPNRRSRLIERLLEHPGWADHWVSYWQDVLAENPSVLKPTLNNTGPFRWWIHESFEDHKSFDRFVTELVMMEGNKYLGAPAGFAMATQNDVPMAAKAHIVGQAFLGLQMKCSRCHDAPFHEFRQQDLFSMAAMLNRAPQTVPKTSSIPLSEEAIASLLVTVTLKPGTKVKPAWPFPEISTTEIPRGVLRNLDDTRERLAALITSPQNKRFPRVIVNRMWQRYIGRGIVEPADDWEHPQPSHPELLDYLSREFVLHDYDLKHVARLILNSHTYQRKSVSEKIDLRDKPYLFAAPLRRRMTAEQLVDSLFVASGKQFHADTLNMDLDGTRPYSSFLNLGDPQRAWHFASLSNERDRPSLAIPFSQDFVSLMKAFGWRASRQDPLTIRDHDPSVLQPAVLANGVIGRRVTRLSDDSAFTELALENQPVEKLVDRVFLRTLTRLPTKAERKQFVGLLQEGYADRSIKVDPSLVKRHFPRPVGVSWSNHLSPEANRIKIEMERLVEQGDPPSVRLKSAWRERMEDMIWALMNSPEFVFVP